MLSNLSKRRHPRVGRCRSRCIEVSKKEFVNILYKLIGSIKNGRKSEGRCRHFGWSKENGLAQPDNAERSPTAPRARQAHQRRDTYCCCICRPGDTERGGLATERVLGSTIGIALRLRCASGWCSFMWCCWKLADAGLNVLWALGRRKAGVGWTCCCRGELSGEPDERDPRSEAAEEWMDWSCHAKSASVHAGRPAFVDARWCERRTSSSVRRWNGQKTSSSSNSKLLAASSRCMYSACADGSGISFGLLCALYCRCAFCEDTLGPRRLRP